MVDFVPSLPARLDSESIKRPPTQMEERRAEKIKLLEDRVDEVEKRIDQLEIEKLNIKHQICELEQPDDHDYQLVKTPDQIHIVAFVDKIEEALLYFKLKEFIYKCDIIKYDTFPDRDFLNEVLRKQPGMEEFAQLKDHHLSNAVLVRRTQLKNDSLPKFKEEYINYKKSTWSSLEEKTEFTESEKQEMDRRFPIEDLKSPPKAVDDYIVFNYFANLVNKVREGYYVMSENPAVEVRKLLKKYPLLYQDSKLIRDRAGLMTAFAGQEAPAMGSDVDASVFTVALGKYRGFINTFKAAGMTGKRKRDLVDSSNSASTLPSTSGRSLRLTSVAVSADIMQT